MIYKYIVYGMLLFKGNPPPLQKMQQIQELPLRNMLFDYCEKQDDDIYFLNVIIFYLSIQLHVYGWMLIYTQTHGIKQLFKHATRQYILVHGQCTDTIKNDVNYISYINIKQSNLIT